MNKFYFLWDKFETYFSNFFTILCQIFIGMAIVALLLLSYALNTENDKLRHKVTYLSDTNDLLKEITLKEITPTLDTTYTELHRYVNKVHEQTNIIVYQAQLDNKRTLDYWINILHSIGEENPVDYAHLLLFTRQVESNGGRITKQVKGSALSHFQIEPTTYQDMVTRAFKVMSEEYITALSNYAYKDSERLLNLEHNQTYAMLIAYGIYKVRLKGSSPPYKNDKVKQAEVHKLYYNTLKGASSVSTSLYKTMGL